MIRDTEDKFQPCWGIQNLCSASCVVVASAEESSRYRVSGLTALAVEIGLVSGLLAKLEGLSRKVKGFVRSHARTLCQSCLDC